MGLYNNDKENFLAMCEDFFDNGKDFLVVGHDKHGKLRGEVNKGASEASLGRLFFAASYNKLIGCGLDYYEDMKRDKVVEEWSKFNGVIVPESSLINWEQRRYEIAKEIFPAVYSKYWSDDTGYYGMVDDHCEDEDLAPYEIVAQEAVYLAHRLISRLKKTEEYYD